MKSAKSTLVSVFIGCAVLFGSEANAKPWEQSIEDVESRADAIWEKGKSLGADTWLGTAYNEVDIPRHTCAILGRMLGMNALVLHLEEHPEPEIGTNPSERELHNLMVYSHSLSNWVRVASALRSISDDERRQTWNLDCVGKMGISPNAFVEIANGEALFRLKGQDLWILGDIEGDFYDQFLVELNNNPKVERIVLGSGGGNVVAAIRAGLEIRMRGLETTLSNNCFSACPLVFIGGKKRTIWSPYPKLGFHQLSWSNGDPVPISDPIYSSLAEYLHVMEVNAGFVLSSIWSASPEEMLEPDLQDLCDGNVVTWIQRVCGW